MLYINLLAIVSIISKVLRIIINPMLKLIYSNNSRIPSHQNDILNMTLLKLTEKIKYQEIRSVDVIKTYIQRTKQVNPLINGVVSSRFKQAVYEAKEIDLLCNAVDVDLESYPLLGIPFSVIQSVGIKDMPKHYGCVSRIDDTYDRDSEVVDLLRSAGAIPIFQGNTSEFMVGYETTNNLVGRTNNPHNFAKISGGAAGGDAALLAADCSVFSVGAEFAGSVRLSAMFCGVYGYKPTPGIVSKDMIFPQYNTLIPITVGVLARNIYDLEVVLKVICDSKVNLINLHMTGYANLRDIKVFYLKKLASRCFLSKIDTNIAQTVDQVVRYLKTKVARVSPCNINEFYYLPEAINARLIYANKLPHLLVKNVKPEEDLEEGCITNYDNVYIEAIKFMFKKSQYSFQLLFYEALFHSKLFAWSWPHKFLEEADRIENFLVELLSNNAILIMPTYPTSTLTHGSTYLNGPESIYLTMANAFKLPAMHIPTGFNKHRLPIGIQVIAGPNMDHLCFAVAKEIESHIQSLYIKYVDNIE